jgi:hypothetical protein
VEVSPLRVGRAGLQLAVVPGPDGPGGWDLLCALGGLAGATVEDEAPTASVEGLRIGRPGSGWADAPWAELPELALPAPMAGFAVCAGG